MHALSVDSTPDTGCTITLLNLDIALWNGIHIDWTKKMELYHTAGGSRHVEGMAKINKYAQRDVLPILCILLVRDYGTWRSLVSHI